MTTKIITIIVLFIANFWGVFALFATIFNLPFKAIFGNQNNLTGNKKLYWIGHLILVFLIFYLWQKLTSVPPTLTLILILNISTLLSMVTSRKERMVLSEGQIQESITAKSAFIWNVLLLYIIGLISGKIDFVWW